MVQAIQVLRFHLLELEKVSHYFCQLKTFQTDRKTLATDPTTSGLLLCEGGAAGQNRKLVLFVWRTQKYLLKNSMNALFDI